jgi:hypothetical protein
MLLNATLTYDHVAWKRISSKPSIVHHNEQVGFEDSILNPSWDRPGQGRLAKNGSEEIASSPGSAQGS